MESRIHISVEVQDLHRSVAFYQRLFQQPPTKLKDDYANFRMETPQLHLALVLTPKRKPEPALGLTNRHFGVELFADEKLNGWLNAAKESGLDLRVEDGVTCCYAVANKFWARDPDGHEWEFWVRHGEAEDMHAPKPATAAKPAKSCCAPGQC